MDIALCIDLDRDYPTQTFNGRKSGEYNFTKKGLSMVFDILNEFGVKANFFIEAESLNQLQEFKEDLIKHEISSHGLKHEDLTRIELYEVKDILRKGKEIIKMELGREPQGFRAPYLKINSKVLNILSELKYLYDSSIQIESRNLPEPYKIKNENKEIIEVPLLTYPLKERKMSFYLWALFEGKRGLKEYKKVIKKLQENNGLLLISLHPWHLCYRIRRRKILDEKEIKENSDNLRNLINYIQNECTITEYLKRLKFI